MSLSLRAKLNLGYRFIFGGVCLIVQRNLELGNSSVQETRYREDKKTWKSGLKPAKEVIDNIADKRVNTNLANKTTG